MNLEIIYEDNDLLAINKPSQLLSVPGRGEDKIDSVQTRCQKLYPEAMAVHRLDMSTSGILLIAKNKDAERYYKNQFEKRLVKKIYIALCQGKITENNGKLDYPLIVDWEKRPKQKVCYQTGKEALTYFEVLNYEENYTRVKLSPHTGRSHQLRLHLSHHGFPILGDEFYNSDYQKHAFLHLHAQSLEIKKPNQQTLIIFSPCPF